jgi:hypothetical protein
MANPIITVRDLACPVDMYLHEITERFGEDPQYYKQIIIDGKPLVGHNGLDFKPRDYRSHEWYFVDDGTVDFAGADAYGFGNLTRVVHVWGRSWYGHSSKLNTKVGQKVKKWDVGGLTGGTGKCNPPGFIHLHLGIKPNGYDRNNGYAGSIDPEPLINFNIRKPISGLPGTPPTGGGAGPVLTPPGTIAPGTVEVIAPLGLKVKWKPSKVAPMAIYLPKGGIVEVGNVTIVEGTTRWRQVIMWLAESEGEEAYLRNILGGSGGR